MVRQSIITAAFSTNRGIYDNFRKVFYYSAKKHMPNAEIICLTEVPKINRSRGNTYAAMTERLNMWKEAVKDITGNIILCDIDIVFLSDMFKAFEDFEFDVAYTKRGGHHKPINGGVVFMRESGKKFIDTWTAVNNKMYVDVKLHKKWKRKYHGMNQASLGYLIEHPEKHGIKLIALPCQKYNACEKEWPHISAETKAIHLKTMLRHATTKGKSIDKGAQKAMTIWKQYAKEADNG